MQRKAGGLMRIIYVLLAVGLVVAGLAGDSNLMAMVLIGVMAALIRAAVTSKR